MASSQKMNDVVGGQFKIRGETAQAVLAEIEKWAQSNNGHRFRYLAVRDCTGTDARIEDYMVAIDFLYALPAEKDFEREHQDFYHKYTDLLRRSFGNGLVRWDISTPVTVISLKAA